VCCGGEEARVPLKPDVFGELQVALVSLLRTQGVVCVGGADRRCRTSLHGAEALSGAEQRHLRRSD
jgi:hypothetical protein